MAHETMVRWAEVLGVEIGFIRVAWSPVYEELELGHAVFYPMETHVNGF